MTPSRLSLAAFLFAIVVASSSVSAVEIIAHRGASADAPENTLPAMELAWKQGADSIETDLWLSSDGKLIVFHDANTKRYEPADGTPRKITSLTWEEAQKLDVGAIKGAEFKGTRIPTLEALLATIPKGKRAVLELKDGPSIVPEFARVLKAAGRPVRETCVISFNYESLRASKLALPELEHYLLSDYKKDPKTGELPQLAPLIERAKTAGFEGLDLQFGWPLTKEFVAQIKAAGLKLIAWTVDDETVAQRLVDAGVDGITTNKPSLLRAHLK
jgi:glycerophosphoryl diester phosphodiesterase